MVDGSNRLLLTEFIHMSIIYKALVLVGLLAGAQLSALSATAVQPVRDDEVLEILQTVTRKRPVQIDVATGRAAGEAASARAAPADPAVAAQLARQDISVARQTGDTRYWGRAQAALAPWWDRADAPVELAVLQATVQGGRHEFAVSRAVLTTALARTPSYAQGWLNLASLERLSARYAESLAACEAVARAGQALYAQACRFETKSLQGEHALAVQGLKDLLSQAGDAGQRAWLLSLLAESEERAGQDAAAADAYVRSLKAEHDLYTALAYSDLLLRTGKTAQAGQVLAPLPETDAVVLRRGTVWKRLGDARWVEQRQLLKTRVEELQRRGDDASLHGRELALAALWLDEDGKQALALARGNLRLQREPLDWWVALQSAKLAKDSAALAELEKEIRATGLRDARLTSASAASPKGVK